MSIYDEHRKEMKSYGDKLREDNEERERKAFKEAELFLAREANEIAKKSIEESRISSRKALRVSYWAIGIAGLTFLVALTSIILAILN